MKIYVAGPYCPHEGDIHDAITIAAQNTKRAIQAGIQLIKKGHLPYIPHLSHFIHQESEEPLPREYWYRADFEWLRDCHALLLIGHSKGADAELAWAIEHDMKVYYSIDEVPQA
jgi:hypothetical protein